jgi:hypothetical protein
MQQSIALGPIGFVVGKITATLLMAPIFPKYVLLMPFDSVLGFFAVVIICILSSIVAIRASRQRTRPGGYPDIERHGPEIPHRRYCRDPR